MFNYFIIALFVASFASSTPVRSVQHRGVNIHVHHNTRDSGAVMTGGSATWFNQNGVAGACGKVHGDDEHIVAVDERRYGDSSRASSLCGKKIKITNKNNNNSIVATIVDDCPGCDNQNSLDLSPGTFKSIASLDDGKIPVNWSFV